MRAGRVSAPGLLLGLSLLLACAGIAAESATGLSPQAISKEEFLSLPGEIGRAGGRLVISLRAEPKTLNPLTVADAPSREVIAAMQADLIHINRATQLTEPALAKSWKVSEDGLQYTLILRKGLRFSDGQPLDADDVLFTFRVYLDESVHAPQRDLLINQWAGLGPFRLKEYTPGQKLILERNPYYWKTDAKGKRLPYLDELVFLFVPSADAQVLRFQSGETDIISRLGAENFSALSRQQRGYSMADAGPGLEYNFLFFNLNALNEKASQETAWKQKRFREVKFRQAVSAAIDREAIVRLVYQGRGAALWGPVTPGNRRWLNASIAHPARSLERARALLKEAGFSWTSGPNGEAELVDADGKAVEFSIITSSSNADRAKMATLIQDDLKQLGMRVQVVPLEFRSLLDRLTQTKEYDACILGIVSPDADPNVDINVWLSSGGTHLWNPSQEHPATPWEAEIDRLMEQQLVATNYTERKKLYDRVQEVLAEEQPMIFLASPDILVGAKNAIGNFRPAVLEPYVLWNVEQLYFRNERENAGR